MSQKGEKVSNVIEMRQSSCWKEMKKYKKVQDITTWKDVPRGRKQVSNVKMRQSSQSKEVQKYKTVQDIVKWAGEEEKKSQMSLTRAEWWYGAPTVVKWVIFYARVTANDILSWMEYISRRTITVDVRFHHGASHGHLSCVLFLHLLGLVGATNGNIRTHGCWKSCPLTRYSSTPPTFPLKEAA